MTETLSNRETKSSDECIIIINKSFILDEIDINTLVALKWV